MKRSTSPVSLRAVASSSSAARCDTATDVRVPSTALLTTPMPSAMSRLPEATSEMLRAISAVVAACCSTAAAIAVW